MNVYVGGFPFEFTELQLRDLFEREGFHVTRAKVRRDASPASCCSGWNTGALTFAVHQVIFDRDKMQPKGFGFVYLPVR
jgi:RNA recognition motif-containing protein